MSKQSFIAEMPIENQKWVDEEYEENVQIRGLTFDEFAGCSTEGGSNEKGFSRSFQLKRKKPFVHFQSNKNFYGFARPTPTD